MNVLVVDDEKISLKLLSNALLEYDVTISMHMFQDPVRALEFARHQECEVAFLDYQMAGINGLELAQKLIDWYPDINIIFCTGYKDYALDAFQMHASGYILKPISAKKVRREMENLRNIKAKSEPEYHAGDGLSDGDDRNKISVHCFGNFEIFYRGEVITFKYSKSKELFAYLVDRRGASCSNNEIANILWEEGKHDSYLRNIRKDLVDTLVKLDCEDVIQSSRGQINILTQKIDCDYYRWLEKPDSVPYQGEYMAQYSWGNATNAWLNKKSLS